MCDPMTIGVVSAVGSLAATAGSMMMQQKQVDAQNQLNSQWRGWQDQQRKASQAEQERLRQQAELSRGEAVEDLAPEAQKEALTQEQGRLQSEMTADNKILQANAGDDLLANSNRTSSDDIRTDFAKRVNVASQDAKKRIAALAAVQSYGNSSGGMQNRASQVLQRADQGINLANNMRQGNLSAYGIAKNVQPAQMSAVSDPFSGIGGALAGMSGSAFGTYFAPKTQNYPILKA